MKYGTEFFSLVGNAAMTSDVLVQDELQPPTEKGNCEASDELIGSLDRVANAEADNEIPFCRMVTPRVERFGRRATA